MRHTTDMVEKRKASDCFQSKDGKTYKLMGTFTDPKNSKYPDLILLEDKGHYYEPPFFTLYTEAHGIIIITTFEGIGGFA